MRGERTDRNQKEIVELMRKSGFSVYVSSKVGAGFPDLVVGYGNITVLVEIKDGTKTKSERKLTSVQVKFHRSFRGAISIIENTEQAIDLMMKMKENHNSINWKSEASCYDQL